MAATGAIAAIGIFSAYMEGEAGKRKAEYEEVLAKSNQKMAEFSAARVIEGANKDASSYGKQVRKVIGKQRSNFAAQGIVLDSGDAADIQNETANIGADEMNQIRNNGYLEAWGIKTNAKNQINQAAFNMEAAKFAAETSLITAGMKGASQLGSQYSPKSKTVPNTNRGHFGAGVEPGLSLGYTSQYLGRVGK